MKIVPLSSFPIIDTDRTPVYQRFESVPLITMQKKYPFFNIVIKILAYGVLTGVALVVAVMAYEIYQNHLILIAK